jgi:23S rRNA (adenine2503-C2)-methyltransferase
MSGEPKPDIRAISRDQIAAFLALHGEKAFRAGQVHEWLWKKACRSFGEMTNLSKKVRDLLNDHFTFPAAVIAKEQRSTDGTVKLGFALHDGLIVEGVLIPSDGRFTACVSSQVGCSLGCTFCATGRNGFKRNLSAGEIFDQVAIIAGMAARTGEAEPGKATESPAHRLSNIVFMGMGEPYLNYASVVEAIAKITSEDGLGMSPQRITVSSVGIPKMIRKMAEDDPKYHFALSLHAATDLKRNLIIPFNLQHPLAEVTDALKYYHTRTGKRFTIEYILFGGFNDGIQDARDLAHFCKSFPVKINIIEFNPVKGLEFRASDPEKTRAFVAYLETRNLVVNVRRSKGKDIDAACGQLAGGSEVAR